MKIESIPMRKDPLPKRLTDSAKKRANRRLNSQVTALWAGLGLLDRTGSRSKVLALQTKCNLERRRHSSCILRQQRPPCFANKRVQLLLRSVVPFQEDHLKKESNDQKL